MTKPRLTLAVTVALFLNACGTVPRSSGAMQLGPDTYRVAVRAAMGNVTESQKMALTEASQFCGTLKKELLVIATERLEDIGGGPYQVTFRCLAANDSALIRPTLERAPDTVIQVK